MKNWLTVLLLAVSLPALAADAKKDVLSAVDAFKQAMLKKDAAALQKLLHEDLTYSHSDARNESKADVLALIPAGKLKVEAIDFKDPQTVRVYGNTAIVRGDVTITNNPDGKPTTLNLNVLQVWMKTSQGWQLVARQSTRLNPR